MQLKIRVPKFIGRWLDQRFQASLPRPGSTVIPPSELGLTRRTLLYFKAEHCVACGPLEMFIGQLASQNGLDLRVIDFRRGELPETVYGDQLLLDKDGSVGKRYRVSVFPTLVLTDEHGLIGGALAGVSERDKVAAGLGLTA